MVVMRPDGCPHRNYADPTRVAAPQQEPGRTDHQLQM